MIFSRLFKRKPAITHQVTPDSPMMEKCYVFIKGVAYMRQGDVVICCDYTLPPAEQQWRIISVPDGGDPQIVNLCYALGLIEGAISMTPVSPMTSRGIGLN